MRTVRRASPGRPAGARLATLLAAALPAMALLTLTVAAEASHFGFLDKAEKKCRTSLAKAFTKAVATADKTSAKCHKDRNGGKLADPGAVDCNVLDTANADGKQKFSKSQQKLRDAAAKKCTTAGPGARHELVSCPEPCQSSTGVGNPMTDYAQVADCLACVAGEIVSARNAVMLGNPAAPLDDPSTGKTDQKCHAAVAKRYGKHLSTLMKARAKCQAGSDKADDYDIGACRSDDSKGKIADALASAEADVQARCAATDPSVFNLGGDCAAASDAASLVACETAEANAAGDAAYEAHYRLPEDGTICPASITLVTKAGTSPDLVATATRIDAGFTGLGHAGDFVHDYAISYGLSCPNATSPCGACTIEGIVDTGFDQYASFARCQDDTTIECSAPFGADPACADTISGECAYYLGPPLPTNAGSTPACATNRLSEDLTGTLDPDTGESEITVVLRAKVHLGVSQTTPCPVCVGDPVIQDGNKDGVCRGGQNHGGDCDVHGVEATFANPLEGEGVSLDCPPLTDSNVSSTGLELETPITTGDASLSFDTECGFPESPGTKCACAVCSIANTKPCANDADCGPGEGTCTSNGQGVPRAPNGCSDRQCTPTGGGLGECQAGVGTDIVSYCDGVVRANGNPFLTCDSDADCIAIDDDCGGDCGDCVLTRTRSCLTDPITVSGTPDKFDPIGVSTFCIPPTVSPAINGAAGLAGPARTVVQLETLRNF